MTGRIVTNLILLSLTVSLVGGRIVLAAETGDIGDDCEAATLGVMNSTDSASDRLLALEELEPTCVGTGVFEAALAYTHIYAGRAEEAERIVLSALAQEFGYERELRGVLSEALFRQEKLEEAESIARALIEDYPDFYIGYWRLADVLLLTGDYEGVVSALEIANSLEENSVTYLLLTMAHYNLRNYRESAHALQTSLRMDSDGLRATGAISTGALSLLALGHYDAGRQLLDRHVELVPEAVNAGVYQFALQHYQQAAEER